MHFYTIHGGVCMTEMLELIRQIINEGLSWGLLITVFIIARKRIRNDRLNARDRYWNALLEAIAQKVGVTWDASLIALQRSASKRSVSFEYSILIFARSALKRKVYPFITNYNSRRKKSMKEYLKKLGKTKFQAYLLVTIINMITLIAYLTGHLQIDTQLNELMPVFNLIVQSLATFIYQWVEGSIDREAQRQQVYVMPGSAPTPQADTQAQPPPFDSGIKVDDIPWSAVIAKVKAVNSELNDYMDHLNNGQLSDVGKLAVERYLQIHSFLDNKGKLAAVETTQKGDNP